MNRFNNWKFQWYFNVVNTASPTSWLVICWAYQNSSCTFKNSFAWPFMFRSNGWNSSVILLRTRTITIILFDKFSNFIGDLAFENIKYKHGLLIFRQLKFNFPFLSTWKKHHLVNLLLENLFNLCVEKILIRFWGKAVLRVVIESWKPPFRLTKISRKVLTWCFNQLKSISFPRESLKASLQYWIKHSKLEKSQFSKSFGVINFRSQAKFRRVNLRSKFRL